MRFAQDVRHTVEFAIAKLNQKNVRGSPFTVEGDQTGLIAQFADVDRTFASSAGNEG